MDGGSGARASEVDIHGVKLNVEIHGSGRDMLYLASGMWFADESAFIQCLARHGRVIVPTAPGFGPCEAGRRSTTVDDLAYLYLDLVQHLKLKDVVLVGASFGGWIAAEMAVKSCQSIASIVFIGALGIKVGDRCVRDIADLFGVADADLRARAYVDPSVFISDVKAISDDELTRRMRARESLARYGWSPFMHDPKLPGRLHRVAAPALFIWGARDQIVSPDYGRAYAGLVPGARFEQIANAAHFPQVERSQAVLDSILSFIGAGGARERKHQEA